MGLGPSASGKTYWAKNVIELLNTSIDNFPSTFFTIDGGDYRALSQVYQIIIESAKKKGLGGIDNLVLAGISMTKKNIFDSNIIKKDIITYLETSQLKISLYVPETLGDCGRLRPKSCDPKINEYVKLTNDNDWVALMIYQHKTAEECPYDLKFQCTGTTSSGKSRETDEGKKYSNTAYEHSISQGLREITKAPNLKFIIHNSGGKKYNNEFNKSIITDLSTKTPFDSNKIQDIESKFHCIYNKSDNINNFK
jgi:Cdc6-like AAA superfamily ATPase